MLVLSRKVGETIQIGTDITLTINRVAGGRVQIGIVAPREVAIRRGELPAATKDTTSLQLVAMITELANAETQVLNLSS
ncbi:carbon storage regulator [Novipirellula sp. SH528]|uniref:carbon storage regulator n=1 Tax=Novipirellula sp. SH528 TaxID=3454466 RepID=UPI003FA0CC3F